MAAIGPPGDIPEIKNVLGFELASAELVAGTGGASVLQRVTDVEAATSEIDSIKIKADAQRDILQALMKKLYNTTDLAALFPDQFGLAP